MKIIAPVLNGKPHIESKSPCAIVHQGLSWKCLLSMKRIPLTNGGCAIVDDEDYEFLMQWQWHNNMGYAVRMVRNNGKAICLRMHRVIMKAPDGMEVDHVDRDKLNNCRANLRVCTPSQNRANRKLKNNKSGFKGVTWHKRDKAWAAGMMCNGNLMHLGYFEDPVDAAIVYNVAAQLFFGEFAYLNDV